jgi:hypothetical protein
LAFIVAASIPNFFGLSSLVAALCILQFTYTFPPMLYLGYAIKLGAKQEGEGFDPATGVTTRLVLHNSPRLCPFYLKIFTTYVNNADMTKDQRDGFEDTSKTDGG